jgi:hypothetical protein
MTSRDMTREQAERLKESAGRQLRYLTRLCQRIQKLAWPVDDPVRLAALKGRDAAQDLYMACHYAACDSGVGAEPKPPQGDNAKG